MAISAERLMIILLLGVIFVFVWMIVAVTNDKNLSDPAHDKPDPGNRPSPAADNQLSNWPLVGEGVLLRKQSVGYSGNPTRELPPLNGTRFLVFACTRMTGICGGWGDRQEGLVTVFLLAYLTDRRFGILMDTPCDVTKFLTPSLYNWVVLQAELKGKSQRTIQVIDKTNFSSQMSTMDFNAKYPEDVVYLYTNRDLWREITVNPHYRQVLPSWARQERPQFFRDVWHTLMKPAPPLEQRLQTFLDSLRYFNRTRPLVCAHVRVGASAEFNDFHKTSRLHSLDDLWRFLGPSVWNGSDVFIASDNSIVHKKSRTRFGDHHHDIQGVLRHIDNDRRDPAVCQAFEDAILDQLILTHCDVLVVSAGSGFSLRAAMIRGDNRQLFELDKVISPANMYKMCEIVC